MSVTVNINQILSDHFANIGAFEAGTPTPYSLGPAKEINEFPDLISQVLEHDQKNEARPDPISLYLQFPDLKDNPIAELITFHVTRRGAGNFGQDSAPGRTKIYHPLQVGTEDDVEHPGFKLFSLQRLMDNYIRLVCWARDQKICLKRALWLEKVMWRYEWFFALQGLKKMRYEGWAEMVVSTSDGITMFGQPLVYWVQTCQVDLVRTKTLDNLLMNVFITNETEET